MRIPRRVGQRIRRVQKALHRAGAVNSGEVTLHWTETTVPDGYLPDVETTGDGSVSTERSLEGLRAFIHYVNIHTTGYVRHARVEHGDVILDFMDDAPIDGKQSLRFLIDSKIYVQKDGGAELATSWDVRCNGVPVTRTVLVTLMK